QRRIFERFYRAESTAGVAGTGLGMSIVKEIVDIHGGRIEIESAPGEGTTVTLWLPRAAARGSHSVTVVPSPGALSISMRPPWMSTISLTMLMPSPVPATPAVDSAR